MAPRRRKRSHGSGQVIAPRVAGGPWAIRYREGDKRQFRSGFETREMAERVLARIAGDAAVGRAGLPPNPREAPTVATLATDFLERRKLTNRAGHDDHLRWKKHIGPHFGHLRPGEVTAAHVRRFVEAKLADDLAAGTVRILVALLSSLFEDLVERGIAPANPARRLPRSTRRLCKPTHDPRTTPFIEKLEDVRRIFLALPEPLNVAYAIGALAGLRTGEVFALKWAHVDLAARRIHVRESVKGPLKDKDSRVVPILDALQPVVAKWKLATGGEGLVIPPMRKDGGRIHKATPGKYLQRALTQLGLARPGLRWYQATRHTFASQWVLNGGAIEKLKEVLGHYSVVVTERYTHLRPDLFAQRDLGTLPLEMAAGAGVPVQIGQTLGSMPPGEARKAMQ